MAAIEVRGLSKRYGPVQALSDLSFSVEPGQVIGFLGPNGAGKTTTMRILLGLVNADRGEARINGRRYADLDDPIGTVGALLETSGFHPGRTARDHLRALCLASGRSSGRVDELLQLVGLTRAAGRRTKTFSMGMRQRLGLASALLGDPDVLLLDEPANGLDPEGMQWLRGFLRQQAEDGKAVLVSSHVLAEVAQTVDSVVIVARGELVRQATVDELVATSENQVRVRSSKKAALRKLLQAAGHETSLGGDGAILVKGASTDEIGKLAFNNEIPILELAAAASNLEDVFLQLTARESS